MRTNVIACDGKHSFELQDLEQLTAVLAIRFLELIYGTLQQSSSIDTQDLGCLHPQRHAVVYICRSMGSISPPDCHQPSVCQLLAHPLGVRPQPRQH